MTTIPSHAGELVLVDDDPTISLILGLYLKKSTLSLILHSCHSAAEITNYLHEVQQGKRKMPALILLDINMPGTDGFELLKQIRGKWEFKELPKIIMFSASEAQYDRQLAEELGANGYQVKPQDGDDFINFLNSLQSYASVP